MRLPRKWSPGTLVIALISIIVVGFFLGYCSRAQNLTPEKKVGWDVWISTSGQVASFFKANSLNIGVSPSISIETSEANLVYSFAGSLNKEAWLGFEFSFINGIIQEELFPKLGVKGAYWGGVYLNLASIEKSWYNFGPTVHIKIPVGNSRAEAAVYLGIVKPRIVVRVGIGLVHFSF